MSDVAQADNDWQQRHAQLREDYERVDWDDLIGLLDRLLDSYAQLNDALIAQRGHPCVADDFVFELHSHKLEDEDIIYDAQLHGASLCELGLGVKGSLYITPVEWRVYLYPPLAHEPARMVPVGPQLDTDVLLDWLQTMVDPATIEQAQADAATLCLGRLSHCAELGGAKWTELLRQHATTC